MTWLWEKVRHSFRSGRLRIQIRKLLKIRNSDHSSRFSNDNVEETIDDEECDEEDDVISSYFDACSTCKLAFNRDRNFDHLPIDFRTVRRMTICPFCGLRYRAVEKRIVDERNDIAVDEIGNEAIDRREQRSSSDFTISQYRLPPIGDLGVDAIRAGDEYEKENAIFYRLENSTLSSSSRMELLLPPISRNTAMFPAEMTTNWKLRRRYSLQNGNNLANDGTENTKKAASTVIQFYKTRQEFLQEVRNAKCRENYANLQNFYSRTFSSFGELCSLFKIKPEEKEAKLDDSGLKMEFVYSVIDAIEELPSFIQKMILKSIINALLEDTNTTYDRDDDVRAIFILLQCPVFVPQTSYVIFAHLLRYCCMNLSSSNLRLLVGWFKTLDVKRLQTIVRQLLQFITVRQFSSGDKTLPPLRNSRWWIPTATKVLALINSANNECSPPLLHYTELYNSALDHIDLMHDYYIWQKCHHPGQFAYCQYPFILSILAKRLILTKDSEQQMILNARKSLVAKMTRHQTPEIDIFFLNINVRRSCLVQDSLNEISCKQRDLKKKLKVLFVGEPGLDMGGLTKEWFLLLVREIFASNYGMFAYHPHSHCYWFNVDNKDGNLLEYNLIGVLTGLAVYNSNILDLHFPSICYRKLLIPPVVPACNNGEKLIGIIESPTLDDLTEILPDVARGLKGLLEYDGNVEEDMGMNFQVSLEQFGEVKTFQLKSNGAEIPVTNTNREEYVKAYLNWILNTAVYEQFKAFYFGFHSVCASNALIMFRGEEIETLVCGFENLDVVELRKVIEYDGFDPDEECIEQFWDVVRNLSNDLKKKFLRFVTGSDRIPVGGVSEMTFKITRLPHKTENLPEAHTCFNQLVLPHYENKNVLREKLITAISNAEGFGLE